MSVLRLLAALLSAVSGGALCSTPPPAPLPASVVWSFTDLDGDFYPDLVRSTVIGAEGQGYAYTVEFEMSAGRISKPIQVHARNPWGLQILPRDVDGDHDLDLVVTAGAYSQPVDVWINDGQGGFTSAGVFQFPASIWTPEQTMGGVPRNAPNDGSAVLNPPPSAVLASGGVPDAARANGQFNRIVDASSKDSPLLDSARPRAPPRQ